MKKAAVIFRAARSNGDNSVVNKWILALLIGMLASASSTQLVTSDSTWPDENSKLGIHGILAGDILTYVQNAVDAGTPLRVVKAVDDLSYLAQVKASSPDTLTVARLTSQHEGAGLVNEPDTNLEWYAGEIMGAVFNAIDQRPELAEIVDYWEPINEPLGGGVPTDAYVRLSQLMIHCMDLAEARGLRLALFSFSAGTPEWADITAIVETGVFARAKAGGHILALHEGVYGDVPINKWYGSESHIPGAPKIPNSGALTGRYRYWYHLLRQKDQVVPLFISEFYAGGGYGDTAELHDIVARLAWYDRQLQRDDFALGFAPFTLGPTEQWLGQDYAFVYQALFGGPEEDAGRPFAIYLPLLMENPPQAVRHLLYPSTSTHTGFASPDSPLQEKEAGPDEWWKRLDRPFARRVR